MSPEKDNSKNSVNDPEKPISKKPISEMYVGNYLERSGVNAKQAVEFLLSPPETPLSEAEKEQAYRFENELLKTEIEFQTESKSESKETIKQTLTREEVEKADFFAEAFLKAQVKIDGIDLPDFKQKDDVYRWLAESVKNKTLKEDQFKDLATKSQTFYENQMVGAIVNQQPVDPSLLEHQYIVFEPEKLLETAESLKSARAKLKEMLKAQKNDSSDLSQAKQAYLKIYLAKINAELAENIPMLDVLAKQSGLIEDHMTAVNSYNKFPDSMRRAIFKNDNSSQRMYKRFDYLRNGIAINQGGASGVSQRIESRPAHLDKQAEYSPEQVKKFESIMLSPEEMLDCVKKMFKIARIDKESNQDGYGVEINKGKTTFSFDSTKNILKIGNKERSLADFLVVVVAHEFIHLDQSRVNKLVGEKIMIASIKGKRSGQLKEAGALRSENEARLRLMGESKPRVNSYGEALKVLENGGTIDQAARAFYEEKIKYSPEADKFKVAREAANRVMRLLRFPGQNSQPMAYAEAMIFEDELNGLSEEAKARALAIPGMDLVDQMLLHQHGLIPNFNTVKIDWMDIAKKVLADKIKSVIEASPSLENY